MSPLLVSQETTLRQQLLQLAPSMATFLKATAEQVMQAITGALMQVNKDVGRHGVGLSITHNCRHIGCHATGCELCQCNAYKQCQRHLDSRYKAFETLKSSCGADLHLQLQNSDGSPANALHILPITLEISAVNARMYKTAVESSTGQIEEADLVKCELVANKEGTAFLTAAAADSDHEPTDNGTVRVLMADAVVPLPKLMFTESSEALMPGQRPKVRLMFRALGEDGQRLPMIPLFLSEEFVVTTIRSTARKPDICQEAHPVSMLQGVGKETVHKLSDIQAAALASSRIADTEILQDFTRHTSSITTVGDFQKLVRWCERDPQRAKTVQRVLKLMKGWDAAAAHALSAVPADSRPRAFYAGSGLALLYPCRDGKVDLEQTAGHTKVMLSSDGQDYTLTQLVECSEEETAELQQLKGQAKLQWAMQGHPGWCLVAAGQFGQLILQGWAKNTMPIADSLCGAASSNMDADFQLQPDCLTDASRPALDSNSQAKVACCQSSESTDTLARLGSEGAASRKRSRQLDDFEVDVLLQSDLKMQRRRQVHPTTSSPCSWSFGATAGIQTPSPVTVLQASVIPDSVCQSTLDPFDMHLMSLQDLSSVDGGFLHETGMVGRSEAAVDWPEYHAQSAFAPLSPVSAPLPAHVVNVTSLSPQGFSMRTSQPSFWQHGMRHQNAGDRGCAGHARGHTSDPRLSMVSQMLSTSTSLPAPLSLQDLELTCGQSLGWARSFSMQV